MLLDSAGCKNHVCASIDGFNPNSGMDRDAILLIPLERIQKDIFHFVRAGNNTRQEDAVVISMRLFAEHDNVEVFLAIAAGQFFNESSAGHSVADDNQSFNVFHALLQFRRFGYTSVAPLQFD